MKSRWASTGSGSDRHFGLRWQAKRDTAMDFVEHRLIQSAVAASLCRRTPKLLTWTVHLQEQTLAEPKQNNETRRSMLTAIRQQLAASAPFDAVRNEHHTEQDVRPQSSQASVAVREQVGSLVERFRQALEAVSGHCVVVRNENEAAEAIQQIIQQTEARRIAISNSPLAQKVIAGVQLDAVLLENAVPPALFDCDAGITSAQWAIAETGTLVLESDQERHRLSSLVPLVHVALIESGRIRQTLGEVLQALSAKGQDGLSKTVTFITGPSRTSDIELTLAIGVHGPGELYVIVLEGDEYD
ncbi:MAG: lactate utilization protein [Acidobacteriota bacterium]